MLSFIFGRKAAKKQAPQTPPWVYSMPEEPQNLGSDKRSLFGQAFMRAAKEPEGKSCNDFLDAVLHERPDLADEMAYFPSQGGYGYTVFIGDEVFKGPQWSGAVDNFDKEIEVLKKLEGSGLPMPRVTCVGKDFVFYGMTRTPGVTVGNNIENEATPDQLQQLAKDIIDFVIGMAKATVTEDGKFMMHEDLHSNNILIDPETKRLTGVIDFGIVRNITRNEWYPIMSMPYFNKLLREEYERRKDELPDPELAAQKANAAAPQGMKHA